MNLKIVDIRGPERRRCLLTGRWVLIAPHDLTQFFKYCRKQYAAESTVTPHAAWCYFCTGNGEQLNAPIITRETSDGKLIVTTKRRLDVVVTEDLVRYNHAIFDAQTPFGVDETVILGFDHSLRLSQIPAPMLGASLQLCQGRIASLNGNESLRQTIFWSDGNGLVKPQQALVHPQWHITGFPNVFQRIMEEMIFCYYFHTVMDKQRCLICDILREEQRLQERMLGQTGKFTALMPFASRHPFETWILPSPAHHQAYIENGNYSDKDMTDLASLIISILEKMEAILGPRFPFTLTLFNAPPYIPPHVMQTQFGQPSALDRKMLGPLYHWRLRLVPELGVKTMYQKATGEAINPLSPEMAAAWLTLNDAEAAAQPQVA